MSASAEPSTLDQLHALPALERLIWIAKLCEDNAKVAASNPLLAGTWIEANFAGIGSFLRSIHDELAAQSSSSSIT